MLFKLSNLNSNLALTPGQLCLLQVVSTDLSVDSRSMISRQSADSRLIVGRQSVERGIDYRPSIGRYFDDAPRPTIGHMSVIYRSTVGGISVNCRSNISRVLIQHVSPIAFFLNNDVINYCYHVMGQHVAVCVWSTFQLVLFYYQLLLKYCYSLNFRVMLCSRHLLFASINDLCHISSRQRLQFLRAFFLFFFNFISFAIPKYNSYNYYHKAYMHKLTTHLSTRAIPQLHTR